MSNRDIDEDFLSISEFAEIVGMTKGTLRHYDTKGVFHPTIRGGGTNNKYRYYSPTQLMVAKMIRVLTDMGVSLDEIRELEQTRTPEKIIKLLCKHKNVVSNHMLYLQDVHSVINTFIELLNEGICATEAEITVSRVPEKRIILGDVNDFGDSGSFYKQLTRFYCSQHEPKLNLSYPVGGYFDSMDGYVSEPSQPARFFSLDPKGNERKAEGLYLVGYTRCFYCQTSDLPSRMSAFAKKNGLVFSGPVYNIYPFDEISVTEPDNYLLQVSALVRETRRPCYHAK